MKERIMLVLILTWFLMATFLCMTLQRNPDIDAPLCKTWQMCY